MHPSKSSWLAPFLRLRNAIDYPLRQSFQWRRPGGYHIKNQPKDGLYAYLDEASRKETDALAARLLREYCLADLYANSQRRNYRENLYYLDLISSALKKCEIQLHDPLVAADIGVSHWFYVQALYACLAWHPGVNLQTQLSPAHERLVSLVGYERDPFRVYNDFCSRYDHALGHLHGLPEGVVYQPKAFDCQPETYDLITLLFPFVFERDHLGWGLPASHFNPDPLLEDAWKSLQPGGVLLIVNQGEDEHNAEIEKFKSIGITPLAAYQHASQPLFRYAIERYVLVARHD